LLAACLRADRPCTPVLPQCVLPVRPERSRLAAVILAASSLPPTGRDPRSPIHPSWPASTPRAATLFHAIPRLVSRFSNVGRARQQDRQGRCPASPCCRCCRAVLLSGAGFPCRRWLSLG